MPVNMSQISVVYRGEIPLNNGKPTQTQQRKNKDANIRLQSYQTDPKSKMTATTVNTSKNDPKASSLNGKELVLTSKNGKKIECEFSIEQLNNRQEKISLKDKKGKVLGWSITEQQTLEDYCLKDGTLLAPRGVKEFLANGSALYIDMMLSNFKDCRIGSALHNANVTRSKELGCNGRVFLASSWNAPVFHYKNGFRTSNQKTNKLLETKIANNEKFEAGGLGCYYYMFRTA